MAPAEGSDSEGSDGGSKSGSGNKGVIVLDQEDHRIPNEEEVLEYAEYLGIDLDREKDLLWIAREGVTAPVPAPWKACTENGDDIFYFNFETGDSIWDHPSDEHYKKLLHEKRLEKSAAKIVRTSKTTADTAGGGSLSVSADESFSGSGSLSVSDKVTQGTEVESKPAKGSAQQGEKGSKGTSEAKTAKDEAMPSRGLAGVGLAGARLEVPAATPTPKKEVREAAGSKKGEGSTEEVEE
ncbi:Cep164, partial [Symbiodinium microadriaticum]